MTDFQPLIYITNTIYCDCGRPARWVMTDCAGQSCEYSLQIPLCETCRQLELESPAIEHISTCTLASNRRWLLYDFRWRPT